MSSSTSANTPELAQRFRFERLWIAAVASNLGDGLVLAAFPLLAIQLTDDPIAISAITMATGLPWLLLGPISGAIVDRYDRRKLMVGFDTARTIALSLFTVTLVTDTLSLWGLYVVVLVIAAGETVVDTSSQSILPALVPNNELDKANGRLFSTMIMAHRFVGPPLGGFLFGIAVVVPVALDAASFAAAAILMFTLAGNFKPRSEQISPPQRIRTSIAEGLGWLWRHKPIRTFAIGAALINIGVMAGESILVLFASEQLGLGGFGFGALFVATAAGYALGSFMAPSVTTRFDRLRIVAMSVFSMSTSLLAIGLAPSWLWAASGLFIIGIATGLWDVIAVSYRQAAVPDRLLGRIMAAYRVIAHGSIPLGAALGGVAASTLGNRSAFLFGSAVLLFGVLFVSIGLRKVELDPADVHRLSY